MSLDMSSEQQSFAPAETQPLHEMPVFHKTLLLGQNDDYDIGCGAAMVAPDGNVYAFPKITTKETNERGYQKIGHGFVKLDPTGLKVEHVDTKSVLRSPPPGAVTYEGEKDVWAESTTQPSTEHWSQDTDFTISQDVQYGKEGSAKPASEGLSIRVDDHLSPEGYEDVRAVRLPNGEYILTAVGIDAVEWWKVGWKDKTAKAKGCRLSMCLTRDISDPETFGEMMQIGPDQVMRNAFFTPELIENANGEQSVRLVYRALPNIHQSVIPVRQLFAMSRDPKLREEFWQKELSPERKNETLLMKPQFPWEAVREGKKWGYGQIASGCSVAVDDNHLLLVTGSPYEIDDEGVTIGRVVGLSLLEIDKDNPEKISVISRGPQPILKPTEQDEIEGKVPNVVFSIGACTVPGQNGEKNLNIYYTGADSVFKVAQGSLEETVQWLKQYDEKGNIVTK